MTNSEKGGAIVAEGKSKIILEYPNGYHRVRVRSKDDITAGDGAKHDIIPGKGVWSNTTTCNVFRLLQVCGIPVAFERQLDDTSFLAPHCTMFPLEVVVRREAIGSYVKRYPHVPTGHVFERLVVEFFLKTTGLLWGSQVLLCDDPFAVFDAEADEGVFVLYDPAQSMHAQEPFLEILCTDAIKGDVRKQLADMDRIARQVFLLLEKAWQEAGGRLRDIKLEFGLDHSFNLLVADQISNDEWRVIYDGVDVSKQGYRNGDPLDLVASRYKTVADLTCGFHVPEQQVIVLVETSDALDAVPINASHMLHELIPPHLRSILHVEYPGSIPTPHVLQSLDLLVRKAPETVILAFEQTTTDVIRILRDRCTVPVLCLRKDADKRQVNGVVREVLSILALHNPYLYAQLRGEIEKGLVNMIPL